ncbi:MAG TPA: hypothetical protein PKX87_02750 [Alphaproteobacteria bacterium]|nr:hypothetical protein [Alphaproteobacteria bacterium]
MTDTPSEDAAAHPPADPRPDADAPFTKVRLETIQDRLCAVFYDSTDPDLTVFCVEASHLENRKQKLNEDGYRTSLTEKALALLKASP